MGELRVAIFKGIEAELRGALAGSGMSLRIHDPIANSVRSHYFTFNDCFGIINVGVDTVAGTARCFVSFLPYGEAVYFELANPEFPDNMVAVMVEDALAQIADCPTPATSGGG
jgi:hypothetical protein